MISTPDINRAGNEDVLTKGEVASPAKLNLFLHVTGRRPDGYHDLVSIMCGVSLYDIITLSFHEKRIQVQCSHPLVPENKHNLVHKAAALFFEKLGKRDGVGIHIAKNIPVGAGLGGGSSNAATVLSELNRHYKFPLSNEELMDLGLSIGADVPFFIFGKPAIATGVGEKLQACKFIEPFYALLINPGYAVSTAEVYKNLNLGLTKCEKNFKRIPFNGLSADIRDYLCNDLETVTEAMHPDIVQIKQVLMNQGADGALMSGSGPTVFGLFSDIERIKEAYKALSQFNETQKFLVRLITA